MGRGRRYLVSGGAGFIGSTFIRYLEQAEPSAEVLNLDLLTYAGVGATVEGFDGLMNHRFVRGDVRDGALVASLVEEADVIVHFAAESHVDRSIADPGVFLSTNVVGTGVLLDAARRHATNRFIHVSTDEVYGPITEGAATEGARFNPSSPYAASKAAADLVVAAYLHTYGYGATIIRSTNNYGPFQHPEKLIPLAITRLLEGQTVPIYGDGLQERDWLWVEDHCAAIHLLVDEGEPGEAYNVGYGSSVSNGSVAERLLGIMGSGSIEYVPDRPGHDRRYALDSSKIMALGWAPQVSLADGLEQTVAWYRSRPDWWQPLRPTR